VAVLVNGNTASAAELLSAVFRDYGLAPIIGTKTFGKGSMQTLIPLLPYGMDGGIKMTTHLYYPPSGEGYNGIGITPDLTVEPQGDFIISDAHETEDNQLNRAVEELLKTLG
jgi:carboxyl-terminal processing protease